MSKAWSYRTVGITELMNLRKMMSAWCGLIFLPLALVSSLNRLSTSECLQGWMVSILQSRKGQFSSVTVSFWYSEQMSSKICLELSGLPLQSLPLIQSLGVKQYSSQEMYMLYLRQSSSRSSKLSSPVISTKPYSLLPLLSTICCSVSFLILRREVAGAVRYCFSLGRILLALLRAFCHFQPKLVSCSPACRNCSGDSIPFSSQSFSDGVNLELKKFFMPSNMWILQPAGAQPTTSWPTKGGTAGSADAEGRVAGDNKKRPPWGLNPRPLSQEPNALPTELDGLLTTIALYNNISSSITPNYPSTLQSMSKKQALEQKKRSKLAASSDNEEEDEDEEEEDKPEKLVGDDGEEYWPLTKSKRLSVSKFKGSVNVSLREYFEKDGKWLPTKKGITLSAQSWQLLTRLIGDVNRAIEQAK